VLLAPLCVDLGQPGHHGLAGVEPSTVEQDAHVIVAGRGRHAHTLDQLLDSYDRLDCHSATLPPNVLVASCRPYGR
jgi:hypothetical protein